jgi:hypothetical protein
MIITLKCNVTVILIGVFLANERAFWKGFPGCAGVLPSAWCHLRDVHASRGFAATIVPTGEIAAWRCR